jgi:hypothetical protein
MRAPTTNPTITDGLGDNIANPADPTGLCEENRRHGPGENNWRYGPGEKRG